MKDLWPSASRSGLTAISPSERPGGPLRTGKPPITSVVLTLRGPKHHEPARPPCPQSSGTCRQGLAGTRGPRARREQPVESLARSGVAAQTGQRDIDPARVAESCSQRRHRGRCADAPSWCMIGKARLGCDAGEGVGRSQSVIVVRDDLGVLEIFANQFESKAGTAHLLSLGSDRFLSLGSPLLGVPLLGVPLLGVPSPCSPWGQTDLEFSPQVPLLGVTRNSPSPWGQTDLEFSPQEIP